MNGGSYRIPFIERLKEISVSVPSRGEWGFLHLVHPCRKSSTLYVSVPSRGDWGVLLKSHWKTFIQCCVSVPFRGNWGVLHEPARGRSPAPYVSAPSRGEWRLLYRRLTPVRQEEARFPYPIKVTGVSYPTEAIVIPYINNEFPYPLEVNGGLTYTWSYRRSP